MQIDDGFWDALDAVVVEVERLEGGEQTHFWRDFCEAILGQICEAEETGDDEYTRTHENLEIKILAPSIRFALEV